MGLRGPRQHMRADSPILQHHSPLDPRSDLRSSRLAARPFAVSAPQLALPPAGDEPNFSYASPDDGPFKRLAIRTIEKATGQPHLRRLYLQHRRAPRPGEDFWASAVRRLELNLDYDRQRLADIPREGPLVVVANHPFGVLDGIVISHLVSLVRSEFKVLTNSVLYQAPEVQPYVLPVDFAETPEALRTNLETRAAALRLLQSGGTIVVFPGGGVATTPKPFARRAVELEWKTFTAKLISASKATVVPIYFHGQNSRLFQIASHVSLTLRLSLLFREVRGRIGSTLRVGIGKPISPAELAGIGDRKELMAELQRRVMALGQPDA